MFKVNGVVKAPNLVIRKQRLSSGTNVGKNCSFSAQRRTHPGWRGKAIAPCPEETTRRGADLNTIRELQG